MSGTCQHASFTAAFDPDPSALYQGRLFGRRACAALGLSAADTELVVLVLNELAANAVMHARTPFDVSVRDRGDAVEVAVADESPRLPHLTAPADMATSGRGLTLMRAASRAWAVRVQRTRKEVRAEIPTGHRARTEAPLVEGGSSPVL